MFAYVYKNAHVHTKQKHCLTYFLLQKQTEICAAIYFNIPEIEICSLVT